MNVRGGPNFIQPLHCDLQDLLRLISLPSQISGSFQQSTLESTDTSAATLLIYLIRVATLKQQTRLLRYIDLQQL
jgi:hypothetical protein